MDGWRGGRVRGGLGTGDGVSPPQTAMWGGGSAATSGASWSDRLPGLTELLLLLDCSLARTTTDLPSCLTRTCLVFVRVVGTAGDGLELVMFVLAGSRRSRR